MSSEETNVISSTYRRPGCIIEITKEAERLLRYDNVNLDSFANHLYLFAKGQELMGNDNLRIRATNGNDTLWIGFIWRKKDKKMVFDSSAKLEGSSE